jgi:hypothetical protein
MCNYILAGFFGLIGIVVFFYYSAERKKKEKIRNSFKNISKKQNVDYNDLRTVPRILIPELLGISLTLTDESYFGLKAFAIDVSGSGFSVRPDFPLRKLPIDTVLNNILVKTSINSFVIKKIRTVRYKHEIKKRLLAFEIISIDENQKKKLIDFINYLKDYLKDEN